jgi:DNA-binding transcriptional MerR regulator
VTVQLWIGEVAKLLGVTTKTLRYYEEIGLLDEPERTESGYRLYDAQDLLRLYRIKHLQDLGLSLERIQVLLQEPEHTRAAQDILRALEGELTSQIEELEARREQVRALLAQASGDPLKQLEGPPPTLQLLQEYLGEQVEFDAATATHGAQLWSQLDVFLWKHAEYQQQQRELIRYMVEHPEARSQIARVMNRVAALDETPARAEEMEALAEEIVALQAQNPILVKILSFEERLERANATVLAQVLTGAAEPTPAQQRLFQLVEHRMEQ